MLLEQDYVVGRMAERYLTVYREVLGRSCDSSGTDAR
jgi:hypothetical protein